MARAKANGAQLVSHRDQSYERRLQTARARRTATSQPRSSTYIDRARRNPCRTRRGVGQSLNVSNNRLLNNQKSPIRLNLPILERAIRRLETNKTVRKYQDYVGEHMYPGVLGMKLLSGTQVQKPGWIHHIRRAGWQAMDGRQRQPKYRASPGREELSCHFGLQKPELSYTKTRQKSQAGALATGARVREGFCARQDGRTEHVVRHGNSTGS